MVEGGEVCQAKGAPIHPFSDRGECLYLSLRIIPLYGVILLVKWMEFSTGHSVHRWL